MTLLRIVVLKAGLTFLQRELIVAFAQRHVLFSPIIFAEYAPIA
jgi:hypothetical protein